MPDSKLKPLADSTSELKSNVAAASTVEKKFHPLQNISIRGRVYLGFVCMVVIMITFAGIRANQLNQTIHRYTYTISSVLSRQQYQANLITAIRHLRFYNLAHSSVTMDEDSAARTQWFTQTRYEYIDSIHRYAGLLHNNVVNDGLLTSQEKAYRINIINQLLYTLRYHYTPVVYDLIEAVDSNDQNIIEDAINLTIPIGEELSYLGYRLRDLTFDFTQSTLNHTDAVNARESRQFMIITIIGLLLAVSIAIALAESSQMPIKMLRTKLKEVTGSNIRQDIRIHSKDDFGQLSHDIAEMIDNIFEANKTVTLADYLDLKIYVTNQQNQLLYVNQKFADFTEIDPDNLENTPCFTLPQQTEECSFCSWKDLIGKPIGTTVEIPMFYEKKLGSYLKGRSVLISWPDGQLANLRYLHDASLDKENIDLAEKFETELKDALEKAEAAMAIKTNFVANISHEIRTPLNSVIGFTELAQSENENIDPGTKKYLERIKYNATDLLGIFDSILNLSKIDTDNIRLEEVLFTPEDIFNECVYAVTTPAAAKDISLITDSSTCKGLTIVGDPTLLKQVLMNLLSNCVRFTDIGVVRASMQLINTTSNFASISFEISDTGIGMTQQQVQEIFDPFHQMDNSATRSYGGVGVGLTITRRLIAATGSKINVQSQLNVGTRFQFTINYKLPKSHKKEVPAEIDKPNFTQGDILIVDDNEMNQEVARQHLKRVGLASEIVNNGQEAVDIVKARQEAGQKPYDIIFMDIHMPVMDGLEASRQITALNTGANIVALTANASTTLTEEYKDVGMVEYLGKPFTAKQLWVILLKYLTPGLDGEKPPEDVSYLKTMLAARDDFS